MNADPAWPVFDPEILAARQRQAEFFPAFDLASLAPEEARRRLDAASLWFNDGGPVVAAVEEIAVPTARGAIRARLYRSAIAAKSAAILFVHGGGWFSGSIDTHDRFTRLLAIESGAAVLSIDYHLAPEYPFPAALTDTIDAWRWLASHAASLGIDESRLMVAGDSAGANLALALCIAERDAGGELPKALALLYGCFAPEFDTPSHRALGDGQAGLTTERMRWYWSKYIGPDLTAPLLAAPSRAPLTGLPPTHLAYAELDPLADDSRLLAAAFQDAGVEHELVGWQGAGHGFLQLTRDAAIARTATAAAGRFLARF